MVEPLSGEEIDRFVSTGYATLRRAIAAETMRAWIADANHRIAADPARWVQGYDPTDAARTLTRFSADDPSTWTWERLTVQGDDANRIAIDTLSPTLWMAICQLLGGASRIVFPKISSNLVLAFPDRDAHRPWKQPALDAASWHIDDPAGAKTLSNVRNGLVLFILVSDVAPHAGASVIAPGSVGRVARALAASAAGHDLSARASAARLLPPDQEVLELTGDAGDVVLCHSLMIHSGAANKSKRIRYLSNPNIRLAEPLRFDRPNAADHSPVERAVIEAVQET